MNIVTEPFTLIIEIKRYSYLPTARETYKIRDCLYPSEKIILPSGSTYSLLSIINHIGESTNEGHYNVLVRDKQNNTFMLLDDLYSSSVETLSSEMNGLSYIFFYVKDE